MPPKKKGKKDAKSEFDFSPDDSDDSNETRADKILSEQERNKLTNDFVRFVIFKSRSGRPVKRAEIVDSVLDAYKGHRVFVDIMKKAQAILLEVFAFELVELPKAPNAQGKVPSGGSGQYVLRSKLPVAARQVLPEPPYATAKKGLCVVIGAFVELNRAPMCWSELTKHLRRLGLREAEEHAVLGKWEDAVGELVTERYLAKHKITRDGALDYTYQHGPRFYAELPRRDVWDLVAGLHGDHELDEAYVKQCEDEKLAASDAVPRAGDTNLLTMLAPPPAVVVEDDDEAAAQVENLSPQSSGNKRKKNGGEKSSRRSSRRRRT